MSDNNWDDFADIRHSTFGVFGDVEDGQGIKDFDAVQEAVTAQGAAFDFRCHGCGKPRRLTLEYPELVALKFGIPPQRAFVGQGAQFCSSPSQWRWVPNENAWGLVLKCNYCDYHYPLRLQPAEPEQLLNRAKRANLINPAGEAAVAQYCNALRQRAAAAMAQQHR